jgi:cytosine/adenosine deaminase-related metal-dependent hydrolase
MEVLANSGTALVHNPQSNMNNAVGVADVPALTAAGVIVGLGTDAMTLDLREELRAAVWSQHLARQDPSVGFGEAVTALTVGNPTIASRLWTDGVGELREGWAADLIVVDYHPPTPFNDTTFAGHLVFGMAAAPVTATVVAGRVLMADGRLEIDLDENEVAARAREQAMALWTRF